MSNTEESAAAIMSTGGGLSPQTNDSPVAASAFDKIVADAASAVGINAETARDWLKANACSRVLGTISWDATRDLDKALRNRSSQWLDTRNRLEWDDRHGGAVLGSQPTGIEMFPTGQGRMTGLSLSWYGGVQPNTVAGPSFRKYEAGFRAEETSIDAGYDRAARRDTSRLRTWLAIRSGGGEYEYLSWIFEALCHALTARVERKYATTAGHTVTRALDRHTSMGLASEDRPAGGSTATVRFLPWDRVMTDRVALGWAGSHGRSFVSRAKTPAALVADVRALHAGSVSEHALVEGEVLVILAHMDSEMWRECQNQWSVNHTDTADLALLRTWLHGRDADLCSTVPRADNLRLVDVVAWELGRWHHDGYRRRLTDTGDGRTNYNVPWSSWVTRLSSAYDIVRPRDVIVEPGLEWDECLTYGFERAVYLGGITDHVIQRFCGGHGNLRYHPQAETLFARLELLLTLVHGVHIGPDDKEDWLGIFVRPNRPADRAGAGYKRAAGTRVLRYGGPEKASDEHCSGLKPSPVAADPLREADYVWVITTRADWIGAWPAWARGAWDTDVSFKGGFAASSVRVSAEATVGEQSHAIVSRILAADGEAEVRVDLPDREVRARLVRTNGHGVWDCAVSWCPEMAKLMGLSLRVGAGLCLAELSVVRPMRVFGSPTASSACIGGLSADF